MGSHPLTPIHFDTHLAPHSPPFAGKTTTSQLVAESGGLRYINVGDWVKEQELHCGFDQEHQAYIIDEDKVGGRVYGGGGGREGADGGRAQGGTRKGPSSTVQQQVLNRTPTNSGVCPAASAGGAVAVAGAGC